MQPALNLKTIFGIKLKRTREAQQLTLQELAQRAGMSTSYVAEIESGKKYPKSDKILQLAQALGCSYDELISSKLDREFDGLQELLSSRGLRDFPFELFGVPGDDLLKLLTKAPAEVAALLRALGDIAAQYDIGVEHFLHAALRSYQELTGNYYEDLEAAAERFAKEALPGRRGAAPASSGQALRAWVQQHCGLEIDERGLLERPALLEFRAVLSRKPRPRLLLNPQLGESQRAFALAREVGYKVLGISPAARSLTTPPDREDSFEQVLSDFKASYFAGALLLPRQALVADLRALLRQTTWQPKVLPGMLAHYDVTSETLMYRLSQLLPGHFGLRPLFLKLTDDGGWLRLTKQLNLAGAHVLALSSGLREDEHYCRRWLGSRLLAELAARPRRPGPAPALGGAMRARIVGRDLSIFFFGLAQPQAMRPDVNAAFTLALPAGDALAKVVRFADDPKLPELVIGRTCEQCPLTPAECGERAAPPGRYLQRLAYVDRQRELKDLTG